MQQDRTGFIGSSDIAALLGVSAYKTPYALYLEKTGEAPLLSAQQEEFFETRKLAEPYILSVFSSRTGIMPTQINRRVQSANYEFLSCEIDFEFIDPLTGIERNGEIKSIGNHVDTKDWGDEFSNNIPVDYLCQTMFTMGVTGRDQTRVVAMQGFDSFKQYEIFRDDELIDQIMKAAIEFWQRVQDRNPPPPQKVSDYKIRKPNGKSAEANGEIISLISRIKDLKSKVKQLESLEDDLKMLIGDNSSINGDSGPLLTWNEQESERFDARALQAENPELYKRFLKKNKFRVLRLK